MKYLKITFILMVFIVFIGYKSSNEANTNDATMPIVNVKKSKNTKDDTKFIQEAVDKIQRLGGGTLVFDQRTYIVYHPIKINCSNITIDFNGATIDGTKIRKGEDYYNKVFHFYGNSETDLAYNEDIKEGSTLLDLKKRKILQEEEYVRVHSDELLQDARKYYYKSEFLKVKKLDKAKVSIDSTILSYNKSKNLRIETIKFSKNINIKNGTIQVYEKEKSMGLLFDYTNGVVVANMTIHDASYAGMNFYRSINCTADSNHLYAKNLSPFGLDYGILFTESQYCIAKRNIVKVKRTGIDLSKSHHIQILNNTTIGCGISPHSGTNITIKGNIIDSGYIYLRCFNTKIIDNIIYPKNRLWTAITLAELKGKRNITIKNNVIIFPKEKQKGLKYSPKSGIGIYSEERNLKQIHIEGNRIINPIKGIVFHRGNNKTGNSDIKIINNEIIDFEKVGICTNRYSNQKIEGNRLIGKGEGIGVEIWASGGTFDNIQLLKNTIHKAKVGIYLTKHYKGVVYKDNLLEDNLIDKKR